VLTRGLVNGTERRVNDSVSFIPGTQSAFTAAPNRVPAGETIPCVSTEFPALTNRPRDFRGAGLLMTCLGRRFTSEFYCQAL
jgi:hypothetical protein